MTPWITEGADDVDTEALQEFASDEQFDTVLTDAVERATEAMAERLEYELRGAWRAGYDYVHVYDVLQPLARQEITGELSLRQMVLPSDYKAPPRPDGVRYTYTYDLTSVPDDVLRRAIRGDLDTDALREMVDE